MSETQVMNAEIRARSGTGGSRAVRRDGKVPGVVYGDGKDPQNIKVDPVDLLKAYRQEGFLSTVIELDIEGKKTKVLPKDVQTHPVKDHIMHADFLRVGAKTKVTVSVPMHFKNEEDSKGLKRGGVLNIVRHEVEIRCPAGAIPEFIEADLLELDIGDAVKLSSVTLPSGSKATITDRDFTIATIAAPTIVRDDEPGEGEEGEAAAEGEEAPAEEAPAEGEE